jgi:hypothetical protein
MVWQRENPVGDSLQPSSPLDRSLRGVVQVRSCHRGVEPVESLEVTQNQTAAARIISMIPGNHRYLGLHQCGLGGGLCGPGWVIGGSGPRVV